MLFVLDTNTMVDIRTGHPQVDTRFLQHSFADIATSVITAEEQLSGWYTMLRKAKGPEKLALAYERLADTVTFLGRFSILSFTVLAIERFEHLKTLKLGVKHMDLRIAAIVLEFNATLVTSNMVDFKDIPGLRIENWRTPTTS